MKLTSPPFCSDVNLKVLKRILQNLKSSIRGHKPFRHLRDMCERINTVPKSIEPNWLPDKWDALDKYRIRVPQKLREDVEKAVEEQARQRKRRLPDLHEVKRE